jgi:HEAT repeat protein
VLALAEGLRDDDAQVRTSAAKALGIIGAAAEDAVPALIEALSKDDDLRVRASAAVALRKIGAVAESGLIKTLQNPDPIRQRAAANALRGFF